MRAFLSLVVILTGALSLRAAPPTTLPSGVLPDGLGVNIHFTHARPGEMAMLAASGVKWVRMDFTWHETEKSRGRYDFSKYDHLLADLERHGLRALFILDYVHPLYDDNQSPHTDEGRRAMARWAGAAAKHFAGRGVLWEMYNEPNITPFWRPKPNVEHYAKLALEVGKAIRAAAPKETYIGPATSGVDLTFLEACFQAGLLEYWSAVSVHPYRQQGPETAADDLRKLRLLIARYAPQGKTIPILSGEWGYSAAWSGMNEELQGKLLARQWLFNQSQLIPLSIWYDWHDDGPDPKEPEHHFGTVKYDYHEGRDPVYDAKPAYRAARTLTRTLDGYRFSKRLTVGYFDKAAAADLDERIVLLFEKGNDAEPIVAAWTTAGEPREVTIPASAGRFAVRSHLGEELPPVEAGADGLRVTLTDAPVYLIPDGPNAALRFAAQWERLPLEVVTRAPADVTVSLAARPPLPERTAFEAYTNYEQPRRRTSERTADGGVRNTLTVRVAERNDPPPLAVWWEVGGLGRFVQTAPVVVTNPLRFTVLPRVGDEVPVRIDNPGGEAFGATVKLSSDPAGAVFPRTQNAAVSLAAGETTTIARVPFAGGTPDRYTVGLLVSQDEQTVAHDRARAYVPLALTEGAFSVRAEGDERVASEQSFAIVPEAPAGLPYAAAPPAGRIAYRFGAGWKYVCLAPKGELIPVEGKPASLGVWIKGDGTGNIPRLRFVDATGQTFQPDGERMTFTDWRYQTFPLTGERSGHWGGAKDGVVHYPIRIETLLLIDSAARQETGGEVFIAAPTLIYPASKDG